MPAHSSNKTTIYLVRHAEVFNPKRIIYGCLPGFGLSRLGHYQAQKIKRYFENEHLDVVYSSPLLRSRQTARIIAGKNIPLYFSKLFTEIGFIKWQGLVYDERTIKEMEDYVKSPDQIDYLGETLKQTQTRMIKGIDKILNNNSGKNIAIISHADPIVLTLLHYQNKPLNLLNGALLPNASIRKLVFNKTGECEKIEYRQIAPAKKDGP